MGGWGALIFRKILQRLRFSGAISATVSLKCEMIVLKYFSSFSFFVLVFVGDG